MRSDLRSYAIAIAVIFMGSVGLAAAQGMSDQGQLKLSPAQQQDVMKGLASEPAQSSTEAEEAAVGTKLPATVKAQPLPADVTAQVPTTDKYMFVKMPDRILLIHPDTGAVAEIITNESSTTGSGSSESDPSEQK